LSYWYLGLKGVIIAPYPRKLPMTVLAISLPVSVNLGTIRRGRGLSNCLKVIEEEYFDG